MIYYNKLQFKVSYCLNSIVFAVEHGKKSCNILTPSLGRVARHKPKGLCGGRKVTPSGGFCVLPPLI